MKLYYPKPLYDSNPKHRSALFPLLKVFLKSDTIVKNPGLEVFGLSHQPVSIVQDVNDADVAVLPMSWDYYVNENKENIAQEFIERVQKIVFIFISGDFGVKIPDFPNVCVYRCSGYKSKLPNTHFGLPVFHRDPLERYYNSKDIALRPYTEIPTVGFCGQAIKSIDNRIKEHLRIIYNNTKYYLGLAKKSPQKIQSTSYNRFKILDKLNAKSGITTNFIIRDQYGGGVKRGRGTTKVAEEYFENMTNSDYIICYRGAGNFSVRFYETLAMGRIPVYINTDGLLPLSNSINWKAHVVWVEPSEINRIDEKINAFHQSLDKETFEAIQKSNRNLWKEDLNLWRFFYNQIQNAKMDI
ncbi:exostosin family protein [Winogradskyella eckloniae]|uniref:exostosin domain-containing protein n=1 Tax=Winogradskyella eckloniae TaxID=1089306 RepID=UPI0015630B98|nr:exostosin family protein [Winogradskyella eckloniae]NRD20549.1 exostosin family protein [Winogradskyella eckloniae]